MCMAAQLYVPLQDSNSDPPVSKIIFLNCIIHWKCSGQDPRVTSQVIYLFVNQFLSCAGSDELCKQIHLITCLVTLAFKALSKGNQT